MKLKDKVFIITGISSGMGKAAAEQFTAEGAIVVGSVRKETDAQIWDDNDRVLPVLADVNHLDDIKRMVAVVKEKYGRLDGICNIAGINDLCYPLLETDDERWETVINTDLRAPFWIMREAMPLLIASEITRFIYASRTIFSASTGPEARSSFPKVLQAAW